MKLSFDSSSFTPVFESPEIAFLDAMRAAGLDYSGPIIADGALHRFKVNGDKAENSWYVLHLDGIAAGAFGCNKRFNGEVFKWCAKGDESLTNGERAERDRRWKQQQAERDADRQRQHDEASRKVQTILDAAAPAPADHPYLVRKAVKAHPGVLMGAWPQRQRDQCLLIPLRHADGRLATVQAISPSGALVKDSEKDFLKGGEKKGAHFVIGDLHSADTVILAEGYATAATLHEATGHPAVMAIDAGNLRPVAEILKKLHPAKRFIVASDNDRQTEGNPGLTKATAAAKAIKKATLAIPEFADGEAGTDWNDYAALHGLDAVRKAIEQTAQTTKSTGQAKAERQQQTTTEALPKLIYQNQCGEKRLVSHQQAAAILAKTERFAGIKYHPIHQDFYHFQESGVFERKPAIVSESAVYRAIRHYSDNFPFSAAYVSGVSKCLVWETVSDFRPVSGIVGFNNGVLRLADLELLPHSPKFCLTSKLPFDWEPDAPDPQPVIDWLLESVGGYADQVQLLRAYLNACITGRPDLQRYLEIIGHGGSGKGTFIRLTTALLGTNAVHSTDLKSLEGNRFESARIYGKKLVVITDAERYHGDVSTLKAITGQDLIRFEEKHKQAGESFTYGGMVMLAANQHTESTDYSSGIQRRRITVRFDHVVPAHERRDLDAEFEPWLPAIAKWAISMPRDEVTRYLRNTGGAVSSLKAVRLEVLAATNPIAAWMLDNVTFDPAAETQVGVKKRVVINSGIGDGDAETESRTQYEHQDEWLYPNYVLWCDQHGKNPLAHNVFTGALIDVGKNLLGKEVEKLRPKTSGVFIRGLALSMVNYGELMVNYGELMVNYPIDVVELGELGELNKVPDKPDSTKSVATGERFGSGEKNSETSKKSAEFAAKAGEPHQVHQVQRHQTLSSPLVHHEFTINGELVHHQPPVDAPTDSPLARTILATLASRPAGMERDELERTVNRTHPKAGALVANTINDLLLGRRISKINGRLVAATEVTV